MRILATITLLTGLLGAVWLTAPGDPEPKKVVAATDFAPEPTDPVWGGQGTHNEPEGFVPIVEEEWESFEKYDWYHRITNSGNVEVKDGKLIWTYTAGMNGGHTPGGLVAAELRHGPYQYHRDEGVLLSENFHGHRSGVNKFRFWSDEGPRTIIGFFGSDDTPLMLGINTQGWPMPAARLWWNHETNYAAPTRSEARVRRGIPHTIETLIYRGTPGNADGWVKAWLNGALVLDFRDLAIIREGERLDFSQIHFAPVWGGTGDQIQEEQSLSVERSYVSVSPDTGS